MPNDEMSVRVLMILLWFDIALFATQYIIYVLHMRHELEECAKNVSERGAYHVVVSDIVKLSNEYIIYSNRYETVLIIVFHILYFSQKKK